MMEDEIKSTTADEENQAEAHAPSTPSKTAAAPAPTPAADANADVPAPAPAAPINSYSASANRKNADASFCRKCGNAFSAGEAYCSRCGTTRNVVDSTPQPTRGMSEESGKNLDLFRRKCQRITYLTLFCLVVAVFFYNLYADDAARY